MIELFNELAIVGSQREDKVLHFLASLAPIYEKLVTALEANKNISSIEILGEKLLQSEEEAEELGFSARRAKDFKGWMSEGQDLGQARKKDWCAINIEWLAIYRRKECNMEKEPQRAESNLTILAVETALTSPAISCD